MLCNVSVILKTGNVWKKNVSGAKHLGDKMSPGRNTGEEMSPRRNSGDVMSQG